MRSLLLLSFLYMSVLGYAQPDKKNNIWYFGYNAGLDFNSGSPVALTDGALSMWEGVATVCDDDGKLLFYTDGQSIWNRLHRLMPDARDLGGGYSSSQSGIIVPYPGNPNLFYVFSVDEGGNEGGVQYALVDITLNGGLGGVVSKNNSLLSKATEKLTAVRHCNKLDYWVIMHEANNDVYRSYLVNSTGISPNYVSSKAGIPQSEISDAGYLKASSNGAKLASASLGNVSPISFFEIMDFDNKTGRISNAITLRRDTFFSGYGVEFSPDNKFLYIGYFSRIGQIDLSYQSGEEMLSNMVEIGKTDQSYIGALQIGPDGKIYAAIDDYGYIGVINDPNTKGVGCGFVQKGIFLNGKKSGIGLPNRIESSVVRQLTVRISQVANSDCNAGVLSSVVSDTLQLSYQWYKDQLLIPGAEKSTWVPNESGSYQLKIWTNDCSDLRAESNTIPITLASTLAAPIVEDKGICIGDDVPTLSAVGRNITWYADSTLQNKIATGNSFQPDISSDQAVTIAYFLTLSSDAGCQSAASRVKLSVGRSPDLYLEQSSYQWCFRSPANNLLTIHATADTEASYSWSAADGTLLATTSFAQLGQPGSYIVTAVNDGGCTASSTVTVVEYCVPLIFTPDAFTPDGDGINDIFEVKTQNPDSLMLFIYNRWGEVLLKTESGSWDGTYRQQPCSAGVYTYKLQASFTDPSGQSQVAQKSGSVLLIR